MSWSASFKAFEEQFSLAPPPEQERHQHLGRAESPRGAGQKSYDPQRRGALGRRVECRGRPRGHCVDPEGPTGRPEGQHPSALAASERPWASCEVVVANTFLPLLLPHAQKVLVLDGNGGVECEGPPALVQTESAWLQEAQLGSEA